MDQHPIWIRKMYANIYPSNEQTLKRANSHQRVKGSAAVSFKNIHEKTKLDRLYQHGSAKIRFPKTYDGFSEAVLINTAGGLTGGDQLDWNISLDAKTSAVFTTQACEKSYQSSSGTAHVSTQITVGENATCHWLPQETILYEGSALNRTLDIQLSQTSKLIALESVMLGREAMGEALKKCTFRDRWRIYRDGKLIFADNVKLEGDMEALEEASALMSGNKAFATLLYCGTQDNEQLTKIADKLQSSLKGRSMAVSIVEGKLVARFLAQDTYVLRQILMPILKELSGNDLPRVWRI
jgi:urease accessory protein